MPTDTDRIAAVKAKIEDLLTVHPGWMGVDPHGQFVLRRSHSSPEALFVAVGAAAYRDVIAVMVYSFTNLEVPPSPDLFRFLGMTTFLFGHIVAREEDGKLTIEEGGKLTVSVRHSLCGESLVPADLFFIISEIAENADAVERAIRQQFGGRTRSETLGQK